MSRLTCSYKSYTANVHQQRNTGWCTIRSLCYNSADGRLNLWFSVSSPLLFPAEPTSSQRPDGSFGLPLWEMFWCRLMTKHYVSTQRRVQSRWVLGQTQAEASSVWDWSKPPPKSRHLTETLRTRWTSSSGSYRASLFCFKVQRKQKRMRIIFQVEENQHLAPIYVSGINKKAF